MTGAVRCEIEPLSRYSYTAPVQQFAYQARSTSNAARLRVSLLNSTAIR